MAASQRDVASSILDDSVMIHFKDEENKDGNNTNDPQS
eukprot:CAMPEP_0176390976 /NCGR_PEP_ID=MMETSP0126-20121128/39638_1 /TAXON_ID=141414 ORGANISM="Strombidinopsis acuminatum, Strain SPMC142" /NCGR_SAMPLE_ID=MMETSP0126 /ASSEMBLY_ACC=CAM_ASM_000229 /LENGTH=37 /DNA_ID= /DNA_START= /DNA_END= /DNA_ORIENTATION=